MINGKVIQFRRGRHTYKPRHFLIEIENIDNKEKTKEFINKEIVWKSPGGKEIKGKITSAHGNKGLVRAIFEKGLPGQAITQRVEIK
jgi:large subunit ribosomal protein L35Ae